MWSNRLAQHFELMLFHVSCIYSQALGNRATIMTSLGQNWELIVFDQTI